MTFPKRLRYKNQGKVWATIYKSENPTQPYLLYWRLRVDGKPRSRFKNFGTYSAAKKAGDKIVTDLATGKLAASLSPGQVTDALAALERLRGLYVATGHKVSLLGAVSEFAEAATRLRKTVLGEAIEGYLTTVAEVKRRDLAQAVEDFVLSEKPRTVAPTGQRPQLGGYAKQKWQILRKFAGVFPGHEVSDLRKAHIDKFMNGIPTSEHRRAVTSAKARNHHRAAIRQFLQWAVRNDFLSKNHRLLEADSLRPEKTNGGATEFYTPQEFRSLLEASQGAMRAMVCIGGLAGLRTAELLRLDWADVWRVKGHIEVTAMKAKTRQRRLVAVCPALATWLRPFAKFQGPLWEKGEHKFHYHFGRLCEKANVKREQNALRHSFVSYHFALHSNENLTATQAGHTPSVLFAHYKGLATRTEAVKWFAVRPAKSDNVIELSPAAKA